MSQGYIALNLTESSKQAVLKAFPPKFEEVRADHVTFEFGVTTLLGDTTLPLPGVVEVVAYVCDSSLEALIVSVDGATARPDGSVFHLTLSRSAGRKSFESNALAQNKALWQSVVALKLDVVAALNYSST
jgi:hypothetical protein